MSYLPTVAWSSWIRNVILIDQETYRITVERDNPNEPGAMAKECKVGYYVKDYSGHTYEIVAIGSADPLTIDVKDVLGAGVGPRQDRLGYLYMSVDGGEAPLVAPIDYGRLDPVALDYTRAVELEIIWQEKTDHEEAIAYAVALG